MSLPSFTSGGSLRIGAKLGLAFFTINVLMFIIIVVSLVRLTGVSHTTRDIIEVEWVKTEAANTLSSIALANARRTVQQLVVAPAERQVLRNEITEGRERFIAAFKLLSEQVKRPEARELLKKAEDARGRYVESQKRFYELLDAGQDEAAHQELMGTTLVQLGQVQQSADALAVIEKQLVVDAGHTATQDTESARLWVSVIGFFAMCLGLFLAWRITRAITQPLGSSMPSAPRVMMRRSTASRSAAQSHALRTASMARR